MCGCGGTTKVAYRNWYHLDLLRGEYQSYLHGHAAVMAAAKRRSAYWVAEEGPLDTPCHVWQGALNNKGYQIRGNGSGKSVLAHRTALEQHLGRPIAPSHQTHHRCGNPRCVNGAHLEALTALDHKRTHMRNRSQQGVLS